ncbi:MAG: hypothetical protein P4L77_12065 [Sulfuriferula sp.]|nr:hypothetical protein [Sulfuriferula sp.]
MRLTNDEEVLQEISIKTFKYGAKAKLARRLEIEPSRLREILAGCRPITPQLAAVFGYTPKWVKN